MLADRRWDQIREAAVLLTSELVTNALVHSASPAEVGVTLGDHATISVRDADTGPLFSRTPSGELEEGGRGIVLVDRLADTWGIEHAGGSKTIWFRLRPPDELAGGDPAFQVEEPESKADLPPALAADRRLSLLLLHPDIEAQLTAEERVTEILHRTAVALDANGAMLDGAAVVGHPVTTGSLDGRPHHQPLKVGAEPYGYLTIFSDRKFDREEEAFARIAAERLALGLAGNKFVDAARKGHADIELLAEATELLAGSTSVAHVLSLSVQIVVPDLAEWAAAYVVDERGQSRRITAMHTDERRLDGILAVLDSDREVSGALATARQRDDVIRLPGVLLVDSQPYHAMLVPLRSRQGLSGFILLGRVDRPDPSDQLAIVELGRRVALALDNARLHEQVTGAADAIRSSLVPQNLPQLARLQLAATYYAVAPAVSVGGDFYDVFQLQDGSVILAVGDVCGKGPAAAAMARTTRDVLRLLLDDGWHLIPALHRLNRTLQNNANDEKFCTLAVARYRPGDHQGRLTVCLAGHPPPILVRRSGEAEPVGKPGGILGVLPNMALQLEEVEYALAVDESLVLYTDGVTEARRGTELFGLERLTSVVTEIAGASPQRIAESVHDAAAKFSGTSLRDDLAVLVARCSPPAC
ncbi:MAG: SpoIIE family protein phosphatase [Acidimicrobiaceae bacterium]|nr:SpoIIE family protein phosphatase [Acidimicrobiaceae bacterium]